MMSTDMGVEAEPRSEQAAGLGTGIGACKPHRWVAANSALQHNLLDIHMASSWECEVKPEAEGWRWALIGP